MWNDEKNEKRTDETIHDENLMRVPPAPRETLDTEDRR